jgi:hypothetical protein
MTMTKNHAAICGTRFAAAALATTAMAAVQSYEMPDNVKAGDLVLAA